MLLGQPADHITEFHMDVGLCGFDNFCCWVIGSRFIDQVDLFRVTVVARIIPEVFDPELVGSVICQSFAKSDNDGVTAQLCEG